MKTLLVTAILLIPFLNVNPQGIGEMAPEKAPEEFPNNAFGFDIMFGEGGLGVGGFYRHELSRMVTGFVDLSFSELKDEKEFEYIDYLGNTFTVGKKNRVYSIPLNAGIQYRLFANELYENLRPYINIGAGPVLALTTPYEEEFFRAFGKARVHFAVGGYAGFGANFGIDKSNLLGINIRYYYLAFFDNGVESLENRPKKSIGSFYLTINIGFMY